MPTFSELMNTQTLLPIIQADTVEDGVKVATTMLEAGLNLVEVVLRTPASLAMVSAIKVACPEMIVGAGTITNAEILKDAIDAGADFIITPTITPTLLAALADSPVPVVPGVSSMSDILLAIEHGYTELKLFPASLSGGAAFLQAVNAVFPQLRFCPTGGISPANKADYLALPNVVAVGGTWVSKKEWVTAKNWQAIFDACQEASV